MTTHYRQLTLEQRYQIESGLACGMTRGGLAKKLGVHPSTVGREIHRNGSQVTYKAVLADKLSSVRQRAARKLCKQAVWLRAHLSLWLEQGFSPEQIACRLKLEQPDQAVSHEWVCRFIDTDKRGGGLLYLHLRRRRKRYRNDIEATTGGGSCEIGCRSLNVLLRSKPANGWATGKVTRCMGGAGGHL